MNVLPVGNPSRGWLSARRGAVALLLGFFTACAGGTNDGRATAQEVVPKVTPPGAVLPSDATCRQRVSSVAEHVSVNRAYNARTGSARLPSDFFDSGSHDPRTPQMTARVTGNFMGTTHQIFEWAACKWGLDPRIVRAQATAESSHEQTAKGDWTQDARACAPGHGLGVDGRPGWCPESWGVMQVRYQYFSGAFPSAITSTSFNADAAYAVWRTCYEGYELWLSDTAPADHPYRAGDAWGCVGRWYSGNWYSQDARDYIACVQAHVNGRECTT